jgi:integration host factor subunit alpha
MTLTKADLADPVRKSGFEQARSKDMVECFFEKCAKRSRPGRRQAVGFGNFQLRDKPPRGRNRRPAEIPITARRVVTFHASQKLKAMVDKNYHGRVRTTRQASLPDHS